MPVQLVGTSHALHAEPVVSQLCTPGTEPESQLRCESGVQTAPFDARFDDADVPPEIDERLRVFFVSIRLQEDRTTIITANDIVFINRCSHLAMILGTATTARDAYGYERADNCKSALCSHTVH